MTSSLVRTRFRRGLAAGVSVAVGALGIVAVSSTAQATTGSVVYKCTGFGDFDLPVVIDTNAPARMYVGESAGVVATSASALPADLAQLAYNLVGARSFDGSVAAKTSVGTAPVDVTQAIPKTVIPDQTTPTAVPFTATSAALPFVAPAAPGDVAITAGDFTATLQFYDGADAPAGGGPIVVTCTAPPGKAPVIDTIVVAAKSTTTLTLSKAATAYGEDVTATAKVVTVGAPDGDVAFTVDGVATKARVDKDGVATLTLPDTKVGNHTITASFVPRDSAHYDGSTTAAQTLAVAKARTKVKVPVTGKRRTVVTKVGVETAGAFGTVPTGKVRILVKRLGKAGKWIKVRKLDKGAAIAGFGKLKVGRYKVVVKYVGDDNHLAKRKVKVFRVRP